MPTAEEYAKLADFLNASTEEEIVLSIRNVEQIIGVPLPESAYNIRQWWENDEGHTQAKNGWLDVGWKTFQVQMDLQRIPFKKNR
ncbi:MAG: hypothetical protein ACFE8J_08780 [Candidatus Heimdallarchaeota archaeon]